MPDEPNLKLLGMWMLLLRTVPLHEEEDTAWFAVNGVPIRYSLREHALISGLDCHEYPSNYKKIGSFAFVDRHFNSHKEITMISVREKLLSMNACGDRLRMAVLYFLGTIIRGKGRYNASFDSFILRVANDVELSKTFPWGRLTFDDALRSITHVMKHLKGKPKKNVNFPGFIIPLEVLAFECIPVLNEKFRETAVGCFTKCLRMCKRRFQHNSMKGFPLEDLYDTLGTTKVINSVIVPTVDEEPLMASITEEEPDYENEEGPSNLWSTWLTVKEKPIFWQELYDLDVAAREFPKKKATEKMNEEASSSKVSLEASLEDVLKGIEERLMTSLSEVSVTVETMNKRLGKIEDYQVVLKRRSNRMKAMEKRLEKIEDWQPYLKKKAKKIDGIEKEIKEMKEKKDNENNEGFDYQGMDYDWGGEQRYGSNGVDATTTEVVEEAEGQRDQGQKVDEKESEEEEVQGSEEEIEAQKEDKGSEEEIESEEEEVQEPEKEEVQEPEKEEIQEPEKEEVQEPEKEEVQKPEKEVDETRVDAEAGADVEIEAQADIHALTPPRRGRTKAEAARTPVHTGGRMRWRMRLEDEAGG